MPLGVQNVNIWQLPSALMRDCRPSSTLIDTESFCDWQQLVPLKCFFCDFCVKSEFFKTSSFLKILTCSLGTRKISLSQYSSFLIALYCREELPEKKKKTKHNNNNNPPPKKKKPTKTTTFIPESNLQWESWSLFLSNTIWTKFKNLIFPIALLCTPVDSESTAWNAEPQNSIKTLGVNREKKSMSGLFYQLLFPWSF